jgi:L-aminopeptidase/D-esterase-like protein
VTAALVGLASLAPAAGAQDRARDLGIPFEGTPGPLNAITDVEGVAVGHTTIIRGEGPLVRGEGPVRTGVTAVLPRGASTEPVFAGWFSLNGNGEMTGTAWIDEAGMFEGPVLITNTHSVGVARDAAIAWMLDHGYDFLWTLPVVAETWDGVLNDINGFHVRPEHVVAALDGAAGGAVEEGAVGGGTGMICNGFKGGIGTASRVVEGGYTVGVLVQCNYGTPRDLRLAGVPVGQALIDAGVQGRCLVGDTPTRAWLQGVPRCGAPGEDDDPGRGSIIVVVATDAPLLPVQLERLATRAALGLGRAGSIASTYSGDLFLAFSTAAEGLGAAEGTVPVAMLPNTRINPLFRATVEATEEAIANALVAAETTTGADDVRVHALPLDRVRAVLARHNRLAE